MRNLNLNETRVPHALLVAPRSGNVEVASYVTSDGDTIASNAGINPYSPIDGKPMQMVSNKRAVFNPRKLSSFVRVGHCAACNSDLMATASLADAIETSGSPFNCTYCSMPVTPEINYRNLITALAEEHDESEDNDESEGDTSEDEDGDTDEDMENEEPEASDDDSDDENTEEEPEASDDEDGDTDEDTEEEGPDEEDTSEDEGDSDDSADEPVVDEGEESEEEPEASDDEDGDTDEDTEEEEPKADEDNHEFASAVRQLRRRIKALGMADEEDFDDNEPVVDNDGDDDADLENDDDIVAEDGEEPVTDEEDEEDQEEPDENAEFNDDEVEEAASAFSRIVAHRLGERPIAGRGIDRTDIENMNLNARAALTARRGNRLDGNAPLKGIRALAGFSETIDEVTPGTNATEGEKDKQVETPGSNRKPPRNPDTQEKIPGVGPGAETSGDNIVDWRTDSIELVATSKDASRWVFVNGRPVAQLYKQHASKGVVTQWDNLPVIEKAFIAVAKRGMPIEEAKEFGYRPHRFVVKADEVVRNAMRRQAEISTSNANLEVSRRIERYQQSVKTALLAVAKGVYPEVKNPMRDALVASLSRISVAEPRGIVDSAMAASLDKFAINVFKKADEIAAKSDDVRNEIASFVSSASFQARVDTASIVAAQLGANSDKMVAGGFQPQRIIASASTEVVDQGALVRKALRSIRP